MGMKRQQYQVTDWQEGQRRLDHYNKWLMDPNRPIDSGPYPGFPGDRVKNRSYSPKKPADSVETVQKATVFKGKNPKKIKGLKQRKVTVALSGKVSHNKNTENLKGNMMAKVTNLSKATEIVKASATKAEALEKIVAELAVSRSNAFVYFTKASKALGTAPATAKAPKAEKAAKAVKANKVTELSPEKAAKKVAEIDAVIAGLKANGAKVASPFAQLGA